MQRILVLNPNSSPVVTDEIRQTVATLAMPESFGIFVERLESGPTGIETDEHVRSVIPKIAERLGEPDFDVAVLACFSDPGIRRVRVESRRPVFGIGECAYLRAMSLADRFGIIALVPESCERQKNYLDGLGFSKRLAATIPLGLSIEELESEQKVGERLDSIAAQLVERGAGVLILGCAGLSRYHLALSGKFGLPVVEPVLNGVLFAIDRFRFLVTPETQ